MIDSKEKQQSPQKCPKCSNTENLTVAVQVVPDGREVTGGRDVWDNKNQFLACLFIPFPGLDTSTSLGVETAGSSIFCAFVLMRLVRVKGDSCTVPPDFKAANTPSRTRTSAYPSSPSGSGFVSFRMQSEKYFISPPK